MKKILFYFLSALILISCSDDKKNIKFDRTDTGIQYYFVEKGNTETFPEIGGAYLLDVKYYYKDTLLFNSQDISPKFTMSVKHSPCKGCIEEALFMMHEGDSAIFKVDAYDFYAYSKHAKPPVFIKPDDSLTFYVRMKKFIDKKTVEQDRMKRNEDLRKREERLLEEYLKKEKITVEPTSSGLYYIELQKGTGPKAKAGRTMVVHYTGYLINGDIFDSSVGGDPFEFVLGKGQVIPGWEEGISKMNVGTKAKLIIPSYLAYGEKGAGHGLIPPYSTLIFEVKLIDMK